MTVDVSDVFDRAVEIATERHMQKRGFTSCNILSPNYEIVGVLGEYTFSKIIDIPMDEELKISGDDGYDFLDVIDVKSSEEYKARHLIEYINKSINGIYCFCTVNLEEKYGTFIGWISSKEFENIHEIVNFGYGDRKAIYLTQLHDPNPLVNYIKSKDYERND